MPGSDLLAATRDGDRSDADVAVVKATHRLIADVTDAFERWSYNVAVAKAMAFLNDLYRYVQSDAGAHGQVVADAVDALLLLLAPAAPHITAELWSRRGAASGAPGRHVHEEPWPVPDADLLVEDAVTMVVQVAGKVRDRIEVPADADEETCRALALASEKVRTQLGDAEPRKVIVRPPKLVNIVP